MMCQFNRAVRVALVLAALPLLGGCSLLGFAPNPVAHQMTKDTERILEATRPQPDIPRELSKQPQPSHAIQPGDQLLVEVLTELDTRLPADQRVMADGTLDLAKFGRIIVAGMTVEEAEDLTQRVIAEAIDESHQVNIRLIEPIHRYYVVGEVNSPGAYPLTGHETVLDAIMEAGGLTARASACDLLLSRPTHPCSCRVALPICYRAITQLGDTSTNYHLQPGDRVFVSKQSLHEELLGCLCGGSTCSRCEKCQQACPSPPMTERSFVTPADQVIAPPPLPKLSEGEIHSDVPGMIDGDGSDAENLPASEGEVPAGDRLDGELEFESLGGAIRTFGNAGDLGGL